ALADSLYRRVQWSYFERDRNGITMSFSPEPERGFSKWHWTGLDESILLQVLALASPTYPTSPQAWRHYTSGYRWGEFQGQRCFQFAPLFGHQYSQAWIDFRGIADDSTRSRGLDYFENARRATLAQQRYAIANPEGWKDYGVRIWGLTACDGPTDSTFSIANRERRFRMY